MSITNGIPTIKHLGLCTQPITLLHQTINLFPPLQYTFNSLMQHNFCLIEFFLDLHNAIRLLRILVFHNVFFKLGKVEGGGGVCEGGSWVARQKFIDYLGKKLMSDESRVIGIANYDSGNSFGTTVGVKSVSWKEGQEMLDQRVPGSKLTFWKAGR